MYNFVVRIIFSIVSGILFFLSFPKFGRPIFAWFCFSPLFYVIITEEKFRKLPFYTLICGVIGYSGIFYWIVPTFKVAGENIIFGIIAMLLLSLYFTVFLFLFCVYLWWGKIKNLFLLVSSASLWVVFEYIVSYLFSGFPWTILGNTQYNSLNLIQVADISGVYGVSFLIILSNLIFTVLLKDIFERNIRRDTVVSLILFLILFLATIFYGKFKLGTIYKPEGDIVVVLLQGNIDQYKKWDKNYVKEIMDKYTKLVQYACKVIETDYVHNLPPVLFIWPESSVPGWLFEEKYLYDWVSEIVKYTNSKFTSYHLVGTVRMGGKITEYYNSAVLFSIKNRKVFVEKIYDKIHLVPFGEYVPFRQFLSKFVKTINELGEFTPGANFTVFNLPAKNNTLDFSTLICYESIFSCLTTKFVSLGAKFLVNITNDAWFLTTSAPYQHFIPNIFRAVENRCFVLRCANTGISAIISPKGEIVKQTQLFKDAVVVSKINIYCEKTFYTRFSKCLPLIYFFIFIIGSYLRLISTVTKLDR